MVILYINGQDSHLVIPYLSFVLTLNTKYGTTATLSIPDLKTDAPGS